MNKIKKLNPFSEGLAAYEDYNGLWGFINKEGHIIQDSIYTNVLGNYKNGSCGVELGEHYKRKLDYKLIISNPKYYLINKKGNKISREYLSMGEDHDGLRVVSRLRLFPSRIAYGYIDRNGNEVIKCNFAFAYDYKDGKCTIRTFNNFEYSIHYDTNINDSIENKKEYEVNQEVYNKLCQEYKEVKPIDDYFIVTNCESFDDIYGGFSLGLANPKGELVYPLDAYDIYKVDEDLFFIDKISESILLDAKKRDMDNVKAIDFRYEVNNRVENNLIRELSNNKDFALINHRKYDSITENYYLVNKENLKVHVIPADILVYKDNVGHIYEDVKGVLKYLDLSIINFNGIDITNTNFLGSNAKINPQTVYNKDLSGVKISATNILYDGLEPNYDGVVTDSNTEIIGEYLDYNDEMKLTLKK